MLLDREAGQVPFDEKGLGQVGLTTQKVKLDLFSHGAFVMACLSIFSCVRGSSWVIVLQRLRAKGNINIAKAMSTTTVRRDSEISRSASQSTKKVAPGRVSLDALSTDWPVSARVRYAPQSQLPARLPQVS